MTLSTVRSLRVDPAALSDPPPVFPVALPGAKLDYNFDLTDVLSDAGATVIALALDVQPSGEGEATPSQLQLSSSFAAFLIEAGIGGREYTLRLTATLSDNSEVVAVGMLKYARLFQAQPIPLPPSESFGALITWTEGTVVTGFNSDILTGIGG